MLPVEIGWAEDKIIPEPNTGCWLWVGKYDGWGYGWCVRKVRGIKCTRAHRAIWIALGGTIPPNMVLDHICRVKCCVNPDHLRVVDHRRNALENSVGPAAKNNDKTTCPKCSSAYEFCLRSNRSAGKSRKCPVCRAAYQKAFYAAHREEMIAYGRAWRLKQKEKSRGR